MKKKLGFVAALLLVAAMSFSIVGCGSGDMNGTYKFDTIQISGTAWDAIGQTQKTIIEASIKGVYGTMEIEIADNAMTLKMAGEVVGETTKFTLDGDNVVPEGGESIEGFGAITLSGGVFSMSVDDESFPYQIKITFKKK